MNGPLATAAPRNGTFLAHPNGAIKCAWYDDIRFKQRVVIGFAVAETESATSIHRRIKIIYGVNAVDEGTASRWASQIACAETGQAELSVARRSGPSTSVTQSCFNLLINSSETTAGLQPESLQLTSQDQREVWKHY